MTTIGEIYDWIDGIAPFRSAMSFDHVGLLVGERRDSVSKAVLALDITNEVIEEAANEGAELIVSHHPVIFSPLSSLAPQMPAYQLARHGIGAICAHTNLDMAPFGVNTCLGECLGLLHIRGEGVLPETGLPSFFMGELPSAMAPCDFAQLVKDRLSIGAVQLVEGKEAVHTVGFCSGSGADDMDKAYALGAQAFLTGEAKHHQLLWARAQGKTLISAGHFATEDMVIAPLIKKLQEAFPEIQFLQAKSDQDPACFV